MFGLGPQELLLILVIGLIIFGPKRIPEIARSLGKAINTLNNTTKNFANEIQMSAAEDEKKKDEKKA